MSKTEQRRHVADRVRTLREALGLTQQQVADEGGLDRTALSLIETGKNYATSYEIRKQLSLGFGVQLDELADFLDGDLEMAEITGLRKRQAAAAKKKAS